MRELEEENRRKIAELAYKEAQQIEERMKITKKTGEKKKSTREKHINIKNENEFIDDNEQDNDQDMIYDQILNAGSDDLDDNEDFELPDDASEIEKEDVGSQSMLSKLDSEEGKKNDKKKKKKDKAKKEKGKKGRKERKLKHVVDDEEEDVMLSNDDGAADELDDILGTKRARDQDDDDEQEIKQVRRNKRLKQIDD